MTAVPVTRTWTAGEVVSATEMNNNLTLVLNFLLTPPLCQVRNSVAQSYTSGSFAVQLFDTEDVDSSGMHSTVTNTSRMTAVYPGWYRASGSISFTGNATGRRGGRWLVNGVPVNAGAAYNATVSTAASAAEVPFRTLDAFLNVGDYLEIAGFQDSGGNLSTLTPAGDQPSATAKWESN